MKRRLRLGQPPAVVFGQYRGCMANMINGLKCYEHGAIAPQGKREIRAAAERSKGRLDRFRFVGLTEEWLLSICLFNFLATGRRFVTRFQLANCHSSNHSRQAEDEAASDDSRAL